MSSRASTARALRPTPAAYGTSYWLDRVGRRPAPATRLAGDVETDVVVVGGGLTDAINLDGGGSTTMVIAGTVVNHPSDPTGARTVSDVLLVMPRRRGPGGAGG